MTFLQSSVLPPVELICWARHHRRRLLWETCDCVALSGWPVCPYNCVSIMAATVGGTMTWPWIARECKVWPRCVGKSYRCQKTTTLWFRHKVLSVTSVALRQVMASLNAHVLHTDWAWAEATLCIVCTISSAQALDILRHHWIFRKLVESLSGGGRRRWRRRRRWWWWWEWKSFSESWLLRSESCRWALKYSVLNKHQKVHVSIKVFIYN